MMRKLLKSLIRAVYLVIFTFSVWAGELNIEGINVLTYQAARENPLNPDNFLGISELNNEIVLIAHGQIDLFGPKYYLPLNIRLKGNYLLSELRQANEGQVDVQEFSVDHLFASNWVVNVGKTQLAWDGSTSSQPLGFFQRDLNLLDLTDAQSRSAGLPLIALSYLAPGWSTTLVYSHDAWSSYDGFNRGLEQWAIQFRMSAAKLEWMVAAQKPQGQRPGLGVGFSYTWSDNIVLHGSGFIRKGTRRPFNMLLDIQEPSLAVENPFRSERRRDDNYYLRYVLGVNLNINRLAVLLEYSHDDRKLNDNQWRSFIELVEQHNSALVMNNVGDINNLASLNLIYDNQTILRSGTRQNYLFSQVQYATNWADISGFVRVETQDVSTTFGVSVGKELSANISVSVSVFTFQGDRRSEFGILPIKNSVEAVFRYYF